MKFGGNVGHGDHNNWSKDELKIFNSFAGNPILANFAEIFKLLLQLSTKSQRALLGLK